MPQGWLPIIPSGATPINDVMSVVKEESEDEKRWRYYCGFHPVFFHNEGDRKSFRMFTAQLVCQGMSKQVDIVRTFGVSKNSVSRNVKKYREDGPEGFFAPRKARGGSVLTEEVTIRAQKMLNVGMKVKDVAEELGIQYDTLRKAVSQGRLSKPPETKGEDVSTQSTRTVEDAAAKMGIACTRPAERVLAAMGELPGGAPTRFESCSDVSFGGVLCALPALIANGLLSHVDKCFDSLKGYYTTSHILIVVAYMALCRIRTVEQMQYHSPGEFGKLIGLDRIPEVRCMREKLAELSLNEAPEKWSLMLSRDWMESSPELAGALYVDGHVRVYHGKKTKLPKKFVSRERLCLRGTTDYWTNDALGNPYFVVTRPVDQGMLEALRNDIIPRLLEDVPNQPTEEDLKKAPHLYRFVIIFDREGYSPAFFKEMWNKYRIACITYHKFPKDNWPEHWFVETEVTMPNGEQLTMKLAEMGSFIGDKKNGLWVREVRKLNNNDHQTSLISTAKSSLASQDAVRIFSRWSQENFFGYMTKHFAIDLLSEQGTVEFTGKQRVINPLWRELDRQRRSLTSKLNNRRARYAALELHPELEDSKIEKWKRQKAELVEEIEHIEHDLEKVNFKSKETAKHIDWENLKEEDKFEQLKPSRKRLMDTIKMIAYRAETAMVNTIREKLARNDDARTLVRDLFISDADILPDIEAGTLTIKIHSMANPRSNRAVKHLLESLNNAEFKYPGTNLKLVYRMEFLQNENSG